MINTAGDDQSGVPCTTMASFDQECTSVMDNN